jgi:hypothetical protein
VVAVRIGLDRVGYMVALQQVEDVLLQRRAGGAGAFGGLLSVRNEVQQLVVQGAFLLQKSAMSMRHLVRKEQMNLSHALFPLAVRQFQGTRFHLCTKSNLQGIH